MRAGYTCLVKAGTRKLDFHALYALYRALPEGTKAGCAAASVRLGLADSYS